MWIFDQPKNRVPQPQKIAINRWAHPQKRAECRMFFYTHLYIYWSAYIIISYCITSATHASTNVLFGLPGESSSFSDPYVTDVNLSVSSSISAANLLLWKKRIVSHAEKRFNGHFLCFHVSDDCAISIHETFSSLSLSPTTIQCSSDWFSTYS